MKRLTLLGSTGSVGRQTLNVARNLPDHIDVVALAAHSNVDLMEAQAKEFSPKMICLYDEASAKELKRRMPSANVLSGLEGLCEVAGHSDSNFVMLAMVGTMGVLPAITAIENGKDLGIANKEILVAAGEIVVNLAKKHGCTLYPVDSEHSAIFQCMRGEKNDEIKRMVLTASGGPFYSYDAKQLSEVTAKDAANHPTWYMGNKVSIDCSTLMNKGFEVIEAKWLFDMPIDKIEVVIHPQSLIHSFVEFIDGSMKAQVSVPSMELPIQYALTYPERLYRDTKPFPFSKFGTWEFFEPDREKYRCLALAYEALSEGGSSPCYLNAANEVLVDRFCQGELSWLCISEKLDALMKKHQTSKEQTIEGLLEVDKEARQQAALV